MHTNPGPENARCLAVLRSRCGRLAFGAFGGMCGLTLIELMVSLAVMAIVVSLAAPSFASLLASSRMSSRTNEFIGGLNLARAEAVRRAQAVSLRANDADNFLLGWKVFPDVDADGAAADATSDTDGKPIRESNASLGSVAIKRVTRSGGSAPFTYTNATDGARMHVVFTSRGAIGPALAAFFKICDSANPTVKGRIVQVNVVGKISLDSTSESCS
jgi:type IV fimbrial biogenesis protein FimT